MDKKAICILLATLADVLHKLKLLKVMPPHEEVESVVMRAFLENRLDYREVMTTYEVRDGGLSEPVLIQYRRQCFEALVFGRGPPSSLAP